jgi:hypothetical protein
VDSDTDGADLPIPNERVLVPLSNSFLTKQGIGESIESN